MVDIIPVSADVVFNYFFSIWVYLGIFLAGTFGALSLFRL
jgi:hypothetical protein